MGTTGKTCAKRTKHYFGNHSYTLQSQVAAVLVPKERSKLEIDELKSWCKKHATMAPYAIPTVWKVVDSIPRNAMGKINKKDLVNQIFTLPTSP